MAPPAPDGIYPTAEGQGLVWLRTVAGHPLLQVDAGRSHLAKGEQRVPQRNMGRQEEVGGLLTPGLVEALLHQIAQRRQLPPQGIEGAKPLQNLEELGRLPDLLA
jgi:hypothetical protein